MPSTSSTAWNASPSSAPKSPSASTGAAAAPASTRAERARHTRAARRSCRPPSPRTRPSVTSPRASKARSSACPAIIVRRRRRAARAGARGAPGRPAASSSDLHGEGRAARRRRGSPWPAPNTAHTVGRWRRSRSPSIRSSWISEKLCTSSTATAPGTPTRSSAPTAAADSSGERRRARLAAVAVDRAAVDVESSRGGTRRARRRRGDRRSTAALQGRLGRGRECGRGCRRRGAVGVHVGSASTRRSGRTARAERATLAAASAAAHRALHRGRPAGVGPRSGEAQAGRSPVAAGARCAALPGTPRNVACRSRVTTASTSRARHAAGSNSPSAADIAATSSSAEVASSLVGRRQRDGEVLPADRGARRRAVRSKTHCTGESTAAKKAWSVTRRSYTRCTLTIGELPSRGGDPGRPAQPAGAATARAAR